MNRVTFISDTHLSHYEIVFDYGESGLLIHCGDWASFGTYNEMFEVNRWFGSLGFDKIITIAGNHDKIAEDQGRLLTKEMFTDAEYLENELTNYNGLKIYGTPFCKKYGSWSFMKNDDELNHEWDKIPAGIDILVTHGPPFDILDKAHNVHCGSKSLRDQIFKRIRPKIVVFGHIHEGYGQTERDGIKFINAACLDGNYVLANKPVVIDLP
jgi:Icc-related predicted phosphoesterase